MTSISAVLTAPHGIEQCLYLDALVAQADGHLAEIVIVDGSQSYVDRSRPGLRHISKPGCRLQGLIAEGLAQARGEWIWLAEDHGRPLPGLFAAYHEAILANPEIDLFSGGAENLTSTSPWSFAIFFTGLRDFWPPAGLHTSDASNANLLVRRSAILPTERALEGGFLYLTLPRLAAAGRQRNCPGAVVDHVLELNWSSAIAFQYHCTACGTTVRRETVPARPTAVQFLRDGLGFVYHTTISPWRTMWRLRGTSQFRLSTGLRLALLGMSLAAGTLSADIRRLLEPGQVKPSFRELA